MNITSLLDVNTPAHDAWDWEVRNCKRQALMRQWLDASNGGESAFVDYWMAREDALTMDDVARGITGVPIWIAFLDWCGFTAL